MSIELVYSAPTVETKQRVMRMQLDAVKLYELPIAEIRELYEYIERVRDALSRILDRADNKDA